MARTILARTRATLADFDRGAAEARRAGVPQAPTELQEARTAHATAVTQWSGLLSTMSSAERSAPAHLRLEAMLVGGDLVVELRIVEGRLTQIDVAGNRQLNQAYLSDRLALGAGPPLNVNQLTERLQILLQGPFIERINAQIEPGDRPGEARLRAMVDETQPYRLSIGADTDLSPSLGEARGVLRGQLLSPLGLGDVLSAEIALADGLQDYTIDYAIPLPARDLTFSVYYEKTSSDVVEEPLNDLDIEGDTSTLAFRLSQPVYQTSRDQLTLAAGLDLRESETSLAQRGAQPGPQHLLRMERNRDLPPRGRSRRLQ